LSLSQPGLIVSTIGIGTTSPATNLAVYGTTHPSLSLQSLTSTLQFTAVTSNNPTYATWAVTGDISIVTSTSNLILQSGTTTGAVYINKSNYVGIGTNNPTNLLTVGAAVAPAGNSVGVTKLVVYGNIGLYQNRLCFSVTANDWNQSIFNNNQNLDNVGAADVMKYNATSGHWFRVGAAAIGTPPTTAMYINSAAVGIGTTGVSSTALRIYEATGSAPSGTTGTMVLQHGSGQSSIVFPSYVNYQSDYGSITFYETTPTITAIGTTCTQSLVFDCENDPTNDHGPDSVILAPSGNIGFTPTSGYTFFTGSVGIGVTNPNYTLKVMGTTHITGGIVVDATSQFSNTYGWSIWQSGTTLLEYDNSITFAPPALPMYINGGVYISGNLYYSSDQRIKTNITPISDMTSLLESFVFVEFDYIDSSQYINSSSFGVIAQQIHEVFPESIILLSNFIPNIYQIPYTTTKNSTYIELHFNQSIDIITGDIIKYIIITASGEQKEYTTTLQYISDDFTCIRIDLWNSYESTDVIFVYGKQVNDFYHIDKQQIGMVAVAALQQLDQRIEEQYREIQQLEKEINTQMNQVFLLQKRMNVLQNLV
jgi:hypothetical protein